MFQPSQYQRLTLSERLRTDGGRRAAGLGLALLLEALLILLLLTLGQGSDEGKKAGPILTTFDAAGEVEEAPQPEDQPPQPRQATQQPAEPQPRPDQPQPPVPPTTAAPTPPLIQLPRDEGPKFDISQLPREPAKPAPPRPAMGPPAPASSRGDTPIVGTAPNGQPLYAAQWYREPTNQELAGYLSTAQGPGWGLIACRTAPEYRVEDCELLGEYPEGSNIGRATLAASWQFKVRPPRKGNRYLVGEWVRIRITYQQRLLPSYGN